jgi:hypothetical protein
MSEDILQYYNNNIIILQHDIKMCASRAAEVAAVGEQAPTTTQMTINRFAATVVVSPREDRRRKPFRSVQIRRCAYHRQSSCFLGR